MAPTPDVIILLLARGSVFFLVLACAVYITRRLKRVKSIELTLLATVFWVSVVYYIASILRTSGLVVPYALGIALVQSSGIIMYLFLHKAFYMGNKRPFKMAVTVALAMAIILVCIGFARDSMPRETPEYDMIRWWHTLFNAFQFWLGGSVQAVVSIREHRKQRGNRSIPPHVIKRYLYFGLSATIMIFQAITDVVWTHLDITTGTGATIAGLINNMSTLAYSIALYFTWVTPAWLARYLDRQFSASPAAPEMAARSIEGISPRVRQGIDERLTSRELVAIIDYLGNILAKDIGKSPAAAKGFLLMAIEADKQASDDPFLSFPRLKHVITVSLRSRLEQIGIQNPDEVVRALETRLVQDQSLLVMLSI